MSAGKRLFGDIGKISVQLAEACSTDSAVILQSLRRHRASVMVLFSRQKSHHWRSFPGCNDNKLLFGQRARGFFAAVIETPNDLLRSWTGTILESFLKSFHRLTRNETSESYSEYHSRVWCLLPASHWSGHPSLASDWSLRLLEPGLRFIARKCI